jgi:hypothetical protein
VIFSATMTNTGGEDTKIWERDWKFYVGVTLPCLLGLIIANLLTSFLSLKKPERVCVLLLFGVVMTCEVSRDLYFLTYSMFPHIFIHIFLPCSTVSVECCYQNVGIATSVALTMFDGDELSEAMGVPFFYGLMEAVILGIYCIGAWKLGWTKAPRDAPIWKVISTSYEVLVCRTKGTGRD